MDRAQVLLVGLPVRMILIQHVRCSCLHLCLKDTWPKMLGLHGLATFSSSFQGQIQLVEVFTPQIHQTLARFFIKSLIRTKKCPLAISLDSFHEEIWDPKAVEEIPGPRKRFRSKFLKASKDAVLDDIVQRKKWCWVLNFSSPLRFYWVKHDKNLNHANINEKENTRKQI